MNAPILSIVIPTFNSKRYVVECVQSALSQTYPHIEVVVDDNTSHDGTPELLRAEFGHDPRFKLFANKEDLNIPNGWNRGMRNATGDFVLLLHSDNLLHPRYAEVVMRELQRFSADVAYTECNYFDGDTPAGIFAKPLDSRTIGITYLSNGRRAVDYIFRFQRMIPTSALTIRRSCFANRAPFDPRYQWDPDIEQMIWLASRFGVVHIDAELSAIRSHGGQAASWKDPTFSEQYRELLERTNKKSGAEPHHFLFHWAWSNQDVCQKLSGVKGVSFKSYFHYQRQWLAAELKILGYVTLYFLRKVRLMGLFLGNKIRG